MYKKTWNFHRFWYWYGFKNVIFWWNDTKIAIFTTGPNVLLSVRIFGPEKFWKELGDTALLSRFLTVPWVNSVEGLARCCAPPPLKGQCHEMDILLERLNILISTFCVCTDGFQGLSKAFHCPIQLLIFYLLLWNYLLILVMLIGCRENVHELTCHRRLRVWFYWITGCKHFQCQNRRFKVFKVGYWKDFQQK